jgi:hypothetical protein
MYSVYEDRPGQKVDVAFGIFFELVNIFEVASRNFIFMFSFNRPGFNLKFSLKNPFVDPVPSNDDFCIVLLTLSLLKVDAPLLRSNQPLFEVHVNPGAQITTSGPIQAGNE